MPQLGLENTFIVWRGKVNVMNGNDRPVKLLQILCSALKKKTWIVRLQDSIVSSRNVFKDLNVRPV